MNKPSRHFSFPYAVCLAACALMTMALLSGCASMRGKEKPLLDARLRPIKVPLAGHSANAETAVYENKEMLISARHVPRGDKAMPADFEILSASGFIFIELTIKNNSMGSIIYKPNYSTLLTKKDDRLKALDFTELYQIFSKISDVSKTEKTLRKLSGTYYDRDETIAPEKSAKRLLVFRPFLNPKHKMSAGLTVNDIYINADAIDVTFAFEIIDPLKER